MDSKKRNGYCFSLAALVVGAVAYPAAARAVCSCTWSQVAPASVVKTYGPEVFKLSPYGTTGYYGFKSEVSMTGLYGFKSSSAPNMYVDWAPATNSAMTLSWEVCRSNWSGTSLTCAPQGTQSAPGGDTAQREATCSVSGTYSASNDVRDRIVMNVWDVQSHGFYGRSLPASLRLNM